MGTSDTRDRGSVRTLQRAALRLRRRQGMRQAGLRPELRQHHERARRYMQPSRRVVEPGLHAVRPPAGRLPPATARPQRRHGNGDGACRRHSSGRRYDLQDRPLQAADRQGGGPERQEVRRGPRHRLRDARGRGARPQRYVPDRRRGRSRQRGARVRPAQGGAPRHQAGAPHRHRRPLPGGHLRRCRRRHGRRLPGAGTPPRVHSHGAPPRGGEVPAGLRQRLRRAKRGPERLGVSAGRCSLQTLGHVRVPGRDDSGRSDARPGWRSISKASKER